MLRKIKLYGELAKFVGHKEFEIKADTLAHAMSFLINNFPGIEQHMNDRYYKLKVGDYELDKTELGDPIGQQDIHLVPVITGAGRGLGKILLGATLIGFALLAPGASLGMSGFTANTVIPFAGPTLGASLTAIAGNIGIALALTGVSEMLTPLPKSSNFDSAEDPRLSFSFNGLQNTSRAGTPVPIVYGEIFTGSVVISASVDTEQVQA